MKIWIYIGIVFILLLGFTGIQCEQLKKVKAERDVYKSNVNVLLNDIKYYQIRDSLNVVSVGNLELKISEYKKYREEDYKLIEILRIDKSRLQQITTAQTETIYKLQGTARDSIVYLDNYIVDTLRCITIRDKWFTLDGCIENNDQFTGQFENRDSLMYVEHIIPKKFLFIKWGCKERRQDIISRNPHTKVLDSEFITIRK